jgi:hypothetical protein
MTDLYQRLSDPFPKSVEKSLKKGGTSLTYIPISEVINRLNMTLGVDNWSTSISSIERDASDPDYVVAQIELVAVIDGATVVKAGIGGTKIKRMKSGDIVDLGDDYKGALSDAIKKAAQQLGVGLYLARDEEAMRLDEIAKDPDREKVNEAWGQVLAHIKSGGEPIKTALGEFWSENHPGEPKPSADTLSLSQALELLAVCESHD